MTAPQTVKSLWWLHSVLTTENTKERKKLRLTNFVRKSINVRDGKILQVVTQRRTSRQCGWFEWKERKKGRSRVPAGRGSRTRGHPQISDATHLRDIKKKKHPATLQRHGGRKTGGSHLSPGRPSCSCVSAAAQTSTRLLLLRLYLTSGHVTRRWPEGRFRTSLQRSWDLPSFACCLDDESQSLPSAAAGGTMSSHITAGGVHLALWGGEGGGIWLLRVTRGHVCV